MDDDDDEDDDDDDDDAAMAVQRVLARVSSQPNISKVRLLRLLRLLEDTKT